jgi:NADPH-dependent 2,4-dienoyl-CoA reductase/sulfur reductase-like enzyme
MSRSQLVVVGAGPAGISAAVMAHQLDFAVTLVDENAAPGGQYFRGRQASAEPGSPRYLAARTPGVRVLTDTSVIDAPRDGHLTIWTDAHGTSDLPYDRLVVCTGAYDRTVALPGWTLPGVLTAGGAHTLAKVHGIVPGRRIVVAGSGPFLLPVADVLAAGGAKVTIVEATALARSVAGLPTLAREPEVLFQAIGYLGRLALRRAAVRYGQVVTAIHGTDRVEAVTVQQVDASWHARPGTETVLDADAVCLGFGFVPQLDLAQLLGCEIRYDRAGAELALVTDAWLRTTKAGVYAAGEVTGIAGMRAATVAGRLAAVTAALDAGLVDEAAHARAGDRYRARLARLRRVAAWIRATYAPREGLWSLATATTIVCRCEDVTVAEAEAGLAVTSADPIAVKTATRAGMGLCQGRICSPFLLEWLQARHGYVAPAHARPWSVRPPIRPVPLQVWPDETVGEIA